MTAFGYIKTTLQMRDLTTTTVRDTLIVRQGCRRDTWNNEVNPAHSEQSRGCTETVRVSNQLQSEA